MVVVVVLINLALNGAELCDVAGEDEGPAVVEAVLLLGLLEELREEGVIDVHHGDDESLELLLCFVAHHDSHAPLRHALRILLLGEEVEAHGVLNYGGADRRWKY